MWGQTPFVMFTRFVTIEVPLQQCPNTQSLPWWFSGPWGLARLSPIKQVCRHIARSVLATWMTWLLEKGPKDCRRKRYKVPAQVPTLPGTCRCPQENKGTKASQEMTLPHLSYPCCHRSPLLLSNHIIRLDASLNWALCWKIFCYMRSWFFGSLPW